LPFECEAGLCKLVLFVLGNLSKVTRSVFTWISSSFKVSSDAYSWPILFYCYYLDDYDYSFRFYSLRFVLVSIKSSLTWLFSTITSSSWSYDGVGPSLMAVFSWDWLLLSETNYLPTCFPSPFPKSTFP
jgi:hypothetical protein